MASTTAQLLNQAVLADGTTMDPASALDLGDYTTLEIVADIE